MKRVTILVCVFNDEATVGAAIESALRQTAPRAQYDILVVDDGSDDATHDVLDGFRSRDVQIVRSPQNEGLVRACNAGLARISTPFFVRLDGDDVFEPDLVASLLAASDIDAANIVATDRFEVSPLGERLCSLSTTIDIEELIAAGTLLPTELVRELGGYRQLFWEEFDLYLRLLESGRCRFAHVPRPLYRYTIDTPNRLTSDAEAVARAWDELRRMWPRDVLARYGLDRTQPEMHSTH